MAYVRGQEIAGIKPRDPRGTRRRVLSRPCGKLLRDLACVFFDLTADEQARDLYDEADRRGDQLSQANECLDMVRQALKEHSPAWPKDAHDIGAMFYNDQIRSMAARIEKLYEEQERFILANVGLAKRDMDRTEALLEAQEALKRAFDPEYQPATATQPAATPEPQTGHAVKPDDNGWKTFQQIEAEKPQLGDKLMASMTDNDSVRLDHEFIIKQGFELRTDEDALDLYEATEWVYVREVDDVEAFSDQYEEYTLAIDKSGEQTYLNVFMDDEFYVRMKVSTRADLLAAIRMLGVTQTFKPKGLQNAADAKAPD